MPAHTTTHTGYHPTRPDFSVDFPDGDRSEHWARHLMNITGPTGVEVKYQRRGAELGTVFIELEQKPRRTGRWEPSGLATTEAEVVVFNLGGYDGTRPSSTLVFRSDDLRRALPRLREVGVERYGGWTGDNPTRGLVVGVETLIRVLAEMV